jgi:hypothetical protein
MRSSRAIFLSCVLVLGTLCAAQSNNTANGRTRGQKIGSYSLKVVGQYVGQGTVTIYSKSVSITADITGPKGTSGSVNYRNLPLTNDRFQGSTNFGGLTLTISGRSDMPANTDSEITPAQAVTGRVSALLTDSNGNGGRLIAIEDPASRTIVSAP